MKSMKRFYYLQKRVFSLTLAIAILFLYGCKTASEIDSIEDPGSTSHSIEVPFPTKIRSETPQEDQSIGFIEIPSPLSDLNSTQEEIDLLSVTRYEYGAQYLDKLELSSEILFDYDVARLRPSAAQVLDRIIREFYAEIADNYVYVVGHTDSDGTSSYNIGLSAQRAINAVSVLRSAGVFHENIFVIAAGEYMPLLPNTTVRNKEKNRRVEIYLSPDRQLPLEFIREWPCPDITCEYAEVSILEITRDYRLAATPRGTDMPDTIVLMESDYRRRVAEATMNERSVVSLPLTVRHLEIPVFQRDSIELPAFYLIDGNDGQWSDLLNRIKRD